MDLEAGQGKKKKPPSTTAARKETNTNSTPFLPYTQPSTQLLKQVQVGNTEKKNKNAGQVLGSSAVTTEKQSFTPCCLQLQPPSLPAADPLQEEPSQAHDVTLKRTALISGCQAALWNKPSFLPGRKLFSYQQPSLSSWAIQASIIW